jgi:hypothetical protein
MLNAAKKRLNDERKIKPLVINGAVIVARTSYEAPKVISFPAMGISKVPVTRAGNVGGT